MFHSILSQEIPGLLDFSVPFSDLPIDSFGLVALRARIEQAMGKPISDKAWSEIETPNDIIALTAVFSPLETTPRFATHRPSQVRKFAINMPHMANGGLSESWLFKELGDLHWSMITEGLKTSSSQISDGNGNRLYATFTRITFSTYLPIASVGENDRLAMTSKISRLGAGTFISSVDLDGRTGELGSAMLMSNFSRRGALSNTSLLKGQPDIPADCPIPETGPVAFSEDYRTRRSKAVPPATFETEYQIVPFHDINGVGLLYFAAYPIISDICASRYRADLASRYSTTSRDIYYFNNADPSDTLIFRIHQWDETRAAIQMETSISRKSDGLMMAYIITSKAHD